MNYADGAGDGGDRELRLRMLDFENERDEAASLDSWRSGGDVANDGIE